MKPNHLLITSWTCPCNSLPLCLCFCYSLSGPDCTQLNAMLCSRPGSNDFKTFPSSTPKHRKSVLGRTPTSLNVYLSFCTSALPVYILIAYFFCCFLSSMGKFLWFTHPVFLTITCHRRYSINTSWMTCAVFCWWMGTINWLKEWCELVLWMYL